MLLPSRIVTIFFSFRYCCMLYFLYFCSIFFFQSSSVTFVTVGAWSINGDDSSTFLDIILWAVTLLTPVRAAVLSQSRSSNILRPDCFSSTHNLYTFSTIFRTSSLYFHIMGILMIFQSLEWNIQCNNLKSHLFREKSHAYFVQMKKKCLPPTGLERLISDSLVTKKLWLFTYDLAYWASSAVDFMWKKIIEMLINTWHPYF